MSKLAIALICPDTGTNLSSIIARYTAHEVELAGLCASESPFYDPAGTGKIVSIREKGIRERTWPDVSYGCTQPTVKYWGHLVPGTTTHSGVTDDTPLNRSLSKEYFFKADNAIRACASVFNGYMEKYKDGVIAACHWNAPSLDWAHPELLDSQHRGNYDNYVRGQAWAQQFAVPTPGTGGPPMPVTPGVTDARGSLPKRREYDIRSLAPVHIATIHYTAGPTNQTLEAIARYQISSAAIPQTGAGEPFPGFAYHYGVEGDGEAFQANDLNRRVWGSAAVIAGHARNAEAVHIVYTGDHAPNIDQLKGIAAAIYDAEQQLGRPFDLIEGHRDAPYPTECPGPVWPSWKADVLHELDHLRQGSEHPTDQNPGWMEPGFAKMWEDGVITGVPTSLPYPTPTGNVLQEGDDGIAIWHKAGNANYWTKW